MAHPTITARSNSGHYPSFSGPYQRCVRMRVQGVRDEMWALSCGFEPPSTSMSSPEALLRLHA